MKNKKIKELIENINQTNVKFNNCDIGATKFDGKAIDAINTIAEALDTQADANRHTCDAIQDLISIFKMQRVEINIGTKVDCEY